MIKRKIAVLALSGAMSLALFVTPVLAATDISYPVCSVKQCNKTSNHTHKGVTYQGHDVDDGHKYHQLCNISGCTKTSTHTHKGKTYIGYESSESNDSHHEDNHSGYHE
jgi:hypothetical protein